MPFNNLFDQLWMCSFQVRCSWLIQFKFKTSPQVRHVKYLIPTPAYLGSMSPVKKRQILKNVEDDVLQEVRPVTRLRALTGRPWCLRLLGSAFLSRVLVTISSSSFHPIQNNPSFPSYLTFKQIHPLSLKCVWIWTEISTKTSSGSFTKLTVTLRVYVYEQHMLNLEKRFDSELGHYDM